MIARSTGPKPTSWLSIFIAATDIRSVRVSTLTDMPFANLRQAVNRSPGFRSGNSYRRFTIFFLSFSDFFEISIFHPSFSYCLENFDRIADFHFLSFICFTFCNQSSNTIIIYFLVTRTESISVGVIRMLIQLVGFGLVEQLNAKSDVCFQDSRMTRTEGISVRVIRMLSQLIGFGPVERAIIKYAVFFWFVKNDCK